LVLSPDFYFFVQTQIEMKDAANELRNNHFTVT
jgi:hypothetical protein